MALQDEFDMAFPVRYPAGALVPSGTYICLQTLGPTGTIAFSQTTSDTTLPTTAEWWHALPTGTVSGSASTATVASGVNTILNALTPIAGNYAYTSANFAAWTSGDAMQSRGTGASDA
ncbi:MAG TPA: hypothetical protein VGL94_08455 [Ktedonobacteraceae bacterium]|jgi:hypothetical protein